MSASFEGLKWVEQIVVYFVDLGCDLLGYRRRHRPHARGCKEVGQVYFVPGICLAVDVTFYLLLHVIIIVGVVYLCFVFVQIACTLLYTLEKQTIKCI